MEQESFANLWVQAELELTIEQKAAVVLLYQSFREKFKRTQQELHQCYETLSQVCCAVLCCAMRPCAVLCHETLCCAVLRCAVLCCAALRCAVLCCACCAVLRCAALCCAVLCCAVLCLDVTIRALAQMSWTVLCWAGPCAVLFCAALGL